MRMWLVDPTILCTRHLLGEHYEQHCFYGWLKRNKSVKGFIEKGLVEIDKIKERHDVLAQEMTNRGYSHKSPLHHDSNITQTGGFVNIEENKKELARRCLECAGKQKTQSV